MEFFDKIKSKLKFRDLFLTIISAILMIFFIVLSIMNGFSSDTILFIPKWFISCIFLFAMVVVLIYGLLSLRSYIKGVRFNKILKVVSEIGDIDDIGKMLGSMKKSKYVKRGTLKFNEKIVFYMGRLNVIIIPAEKIRSIKAEIEGGKKGDDSHIRIVYGLNSLKIRTGKENNIALLKEMKETFKELS